MGSGTELNQFLRIFLPTIGIEKYACVNENTCICHIFHCQIYMLNFI